MQFIEKIKVQYRAQKYQTKLDPGEIAYLYSVLKPGDTALDIGAHKAGYLYHLQRAVGANGMVHAFEPQPTLFNYLEEVVAVFAWQHVQVHERALSDKNSEKPLYIPLNKTGSSTSPGATLVPHSSRADYRKVEGIKTILLDDFCQAYQFVPKLIKIDVEGNELAVFKGGVGTLERHRPKILVEIEARHIGKEKALACFQFLMDIGYEAYFIQGKSKRPLADFIFEEHQNPARSKPYCNNFIFE